MHLLYVEIKQVKKDITEVLTINYKVLIQEHDLNTILNCGQGFNCADSKTFRGTIDITDIIF